MLVLEIIDTERYLLATERLLAIYALLEASLLASSLMEMQKVFLTIESTQT
jgi:hypothetical protein